LEGLGFDAFMVVLALFLVALNGLFVAAEFGFVKIRPHRWIASCKKGGRRRVW
jgi:CBS domain containing-hemolysin-like protein